MNKKQLEMVFRPALKDPIFKKIFELVKLNSRGKIWIIGGFIYRNIINHLKNLPIYNSDIDFIVEHRKSTLKKFQVGGLY